MSNDEIEGLGEALSSISEQYRAQMDHLGEELEAIAQPFQSAHTLLLDWQDQLSSSVQPLLEELSKIDWEDVSVRMGQSCDRLACLGWTLPMTFTPRQLVELAEQGGSDDAVERYMLGYFTDPDGANFRALRGAISASEALKGWCSLLQQCLDAYDRGHYVIPVPALLAVIEGAVAENAGKLRSGQTRPAKNASVLESSAANGSMERLIWRSTRIVVESLFADSHFGNPPPGNLNRHWVLHGRDQTEWGQVDVLRLFNLLATIA